MHPSLATAHSNLASLVKEQQPHLFHLAVRHYFEAIRIDPYLADAYSNLGNAYREAGLLEEAIRARAQPPRPPPYQYPCAFSNAARAHVGAVRLLSLTDRRCNLWQACTWRP